MSDHYEPPMIVRPFKIHHPKSEYCIALYHGTPWLLWRHPDGQWVTEQSVQVLTPGREVDSEALRIAKNYENAPCFAELLGEVDDENPCGCPVCGHRAIVRAYTQEADDA